MVTPPKKILRFELKIPPLPPPHFPFALPLPLPPPGHCEEGGGPPAGFLTRSKTSNLTLGSAYCIFHTYIISIVPNSAWRNFPRMRRRKSLFPREWRETLLGALSPPGLPISSLETTSQTPQAQKTMKPIRQLFSSADRSQIESVIQEEERVKAPKNAFV